jgi:hypothetical protein
MNNLKSINSIFMASKALGGNTSYEPFRDALFSDPTVMAALVAIPQGPKRTLYLLPADVGDAFAHKYAATHQKAQPGTKRQLELDLEPADSTDFAATLARMESKIDRLMAIWSSIDDDGK